MYNVSGYALLSAIKLKTSHTAITMIILAIITALVAQIIDYRVQDGVSYYFHPKTKKAHINRVLSKYKDKTREWRLYVQHVFLLDVQHQLLFFLSYFFQQSLSKDI